MNNYSFHELLSNSTDIEWFDILTKEVQAKTVEEFYEGEFEEPFTLFMNPRWFYDRKLNENDPNHISFLAHKNRVKSKGKGYFSIESYHTAEEKLNQALERDKKTSGNLDYVYNVAMSLFGLTPTLTLDPLDPKKYITKLEGQLTYNMRKTFLNFFSREIRNSIIGKNQYFNQHSIPAHNNVINALEYIEHRNEAISFKNLRDPDYKKASKFVGLRNNESREFSYGLEELMLDLQNSVVFTSPLTSIDESNEWFFTRIYFFNYLNELYHSNKIKIIGL